jgi:hypothetical protein
MQLMFFPFFRPDDCAARRGGFTDRGLAAQSIYAGSLKH